MRHFDTVIIGGGIVGLAVARELVRREPRQTIAILEKESSLGRHASGRNSGVIHSGIYYAPGSLKAKLCAGGAAEMLAFCRERGLPIDPCGKVLLPTNEDDSQLDLLLERSRVNRARAELVDAARLQELEPAARSGSGRALFVPETAVVDPRAVLRALEDELTRAGVALLMKHGVEEIRVDSLAAGNETIAFGRMINAAGLHADTVAKRCGVGEQYTILPFRGSYYELDPAAGIPIRRLIYPVPDLRVPFLGIHFTRSIDGRVFVGPSATPALGREHYGGIRGIGLGDSARMLATMLPQYLGNRDGMRRLIHEEALRTSRFFFANAAMKLVPELRARHLRPSSKVGLRAQLFDLRSKQLVMDFVVERGERSVHVLNAVSPGFTSAFSFARVIADDWARLP